MEAMVVVIHVFGLNCTSQVSCHFSSLLRSIRIGYHCFDSDMQKAIIINNKQGNKAANTKDVIVVGVSDVTLMTCCDLPLSSKEVFYPCLNDTNIAC